jgi:hypothetical protein
MTRMLDVLEAFLNLHGHSYCRLDGSTKPEQRQVGGQVSAGIHLHSPGGLRKLSVCSRPTQVAMAGGPALTLASCMHFYTDAGAGPKHNHVPPLDAGRIHM